MSVPQQDLRGRYDRSLSAGQRAERQRQRILRATVELLDQSGVVGLTVDPVIARARVGRNTFYAHFDNVEDLLGGVREWAIDALFDEVDARRVGCVTPLERFRGLADAWLGAISRHPVIARTALSHTVGIDGRHLGTRASAPLLRRLRDIAREAQADGFMAEPPSDETLSGLAGAFIGVALDHLSASRERIEPAAEVLARLAAKALR